MKSEEKQRMRNAIEQSIIFSMLIYPTSFSTLSQYLTNPIPEFQPKSFKQFNNEYESLLIKMNPLLLDHITEEEKEINSIIQEDKIEQFKSKIAKNLLDPNHKDRNGFSLIEKCTFFDSTQCLNYLIEENVSIERHSIEIEEEYHEIGLMEYGALKGNRNIINICLEKGQKIQKETLILGLIAHHNELVEWMIKEGNFDETIKSEILGIADNIEFNEKLLKSGININAKDNEGYTALMKASQKGHIEVVRELIERGADINAKNKNGWTALMFASEDGHLEVARELIERGADIDAKNKYGWTALMYASWKGHIEIVRELKNSEEDYNIVDPLFTN